MKNTGMYNLESSQFSKYLQNSNTTTQELWGCIAAGKIIYIQNVFLSIGKGKINYFGYYMSQ